MIGGRAPDRGWKRTFDDPIPLPDGRELVTLKDAGAYITKLPKAGPIGAAPDSSAFDADGT
jgi:hypothetical protein